MPFNEILLKPTSLAGSGRVRCFDFSWGGCKITQITTFCPDVIGPGPVHTYLINDEALVMMDAGIPTDLAKVFFYNWRNQPIPEEIQSLPFDHSKREFMEGMKLSGHAVKDIDLLVISHGHLDHFFMASSILSETEAQISAHILDTPEICNPWSLLNMWLSRQQQMAAVGMPPPLSPKQFLRTDDVHAFDFGHLGVFIEVDVPFLRNGPLVVNGTALERMAVRHLPGHTSGSIGLLVGKPEGEKVLLCGDVLLNPITPHPDDLLVYLQTLEELGTYDDVALVLPAHGSAIRDLKGRVSFLKEHHRNRLRLTYEACRSPRCVWDIASMPDYFDTYVDPTKFNFLAGHEALVHMEVLMMAGGLARTHIDDKVHYFQNCDLSFDEIYGRVTELVADKGSRALMRY